MLKQANKWLKDTIKPYKYEDQKIRDQRQLIDGVVNFVVGAIKLLFKLINLMLIVPIKALIVDPKNFAAKYNEIGQGDIATIISTFQQFVTGFAQLLTSPILPFRIFFRWLITPTEGISVLKNSGLKRLVDEYLKDNGEPQTMRSFGIAKVSEGIPLGISNKVKKYVRNNQKDSKKIDEILSKPILTYYKMKEIKDLINLETNFKLENKNIRTGIQY